MEALKKLDKGIIRLCAVVGGATLVGTILVIVMNVFARLLFMKSFAWAEEIAYLMLNWAVFFGAVLLFRNNGLVAIDVLVNALPKGAQKVCNILVYAMLTLVNLGLIVWSFTLAMSTWTGRATPILKIPFFWYYIAVTIAAIFLAGYSVMFLKKVILNEQIEETALQDRA